MALVGSDGLAGVYWRGADNNIYTKNNLGQTAKAGAGTGVMKSGNQNIGGLNYREILDPNQSNNTGGSDNSGNFTGSGDGGDGGAAAREAQSKADEMGYWGDQIGSLQRILGQTDTTRDQGLTRINDTYNDSVNSTNAQQSKTLRNYQIQRDDTGREKVGALENVDTEARNGYNSIQRVLGLAGAGVSSASKELAPWAVSKEATGNRTKVVDTFGTNLRNLSLAEDDAKDQYGNVLADLGKQKNSKTEDFLRGIEQQKQTLNQQLADAATKKAMAGGASYEQARASRAPFEQGVNNSQNILTSLFERYRNPGYEAKPVTVQKVDLAKYAVDPLKLSTEQSQGTPAEVASYLPWLKKDEKAVI